MKTGKTLSRKIVFSFSVISAGVLLIIFTTLERINKEAFFAVETEKATIIADTVEPLLALDIYLELNQKKEQLARQLLENPDILAVRIHEGERLAVNIESEAFRADEKNFFLIEKAILQPNTTLQIGKLELVYSGKRYEELISRYTVLVLYLLVGLSVIFLLLGLYIRNLLAPLKKIARSLYFYRPDREMAFPYADEENEIGIISGALNQMHATVYANFMTQKEKTIHLEEQVDEKEQLIYESNQRFKEVFNNTVFGIWVIDKNRKTIDANGKLLEILQSSRTDLIGTAISGYVAKEDRAFFKKMSVLSDDSPDKQQFEVQLVDKTGDVLPAYFHAMAMRNRNNEIIGAFAFVEDLREKRMLQAELERKTRSLERLNSQLEEEVAKEVARRRESEHKMYQQSRLAAMGQLIVAISHNWRNPLNALGLLIQDIEDAYDFGELDKAYLHDTIRKSVAQINYMSQTIDDFGSFFRPVGEEHAFHVATLIESTVDELNKEMRQSDITLSVEPESRDYTMFGYPDELQKVIENIIKNARDAIMEKQLQAPFPGKITLAYSARQETKTITVKDNGGGIPETIIDKVFDPYYTTKEQGKGTGLGLYMSKVIIETNMNGKLTVQNSDNGAEFKIEF
jgi:PAS domain S-box-containing protein